MRRVELSLILTPERRNKKQLIPAIKVIMYIYIIKLLDTSLYLKGITKFWYGVMNFVQINILEAYAFLQYSLIIVPVKIESKVMKL